MTLRVVYYILRLYRYNSFGCLLASICFSMIVFPSLVLLMLAPRVFLLLAPRRTRGRFNAAIAIIRATSCRKKRADEFLRSQQRTPTIAPTHDIDCYFAWRLASPSTPDSLVLLMMSQLRQLLQGCGFPSLSSSSENSSAVYWPTTSSNATTSRALSAPGSTILFSTPGYLTLVHIFI